MTVLYLCKGTLLIQRYVYTLLVINKFKVCQRTKEDKIIGKINYWNSTILDESLNNKRTNVIRLHVKFIYVRRIKLFQLLGLPYIFAPTNLR